MNDSGEEKTWSNQQQVKNLENDKLGNVDFWDIYQNFLRDKKVILQE